MSHLNYKVLARPCCSDSVCKTKKDASWRNKKVFLYKVFLNGAAVKNRGDLSLQAIDGRNQHRLRPAVRHLRRWNRGSAWPDREKT